MVYANNTCIVDALMLEYGRVGPVVQRLEPPAHNGVVVGSNPTGPTNGGCSSVG